MSTRTLHPERPCRDCGQPQGDHYLGSALCKTCHHKSAKASAAKNPENSKRLWRESARRAHRLLREAVLDGYGRACARCGLTDERVLDLDHVDGGGVQHRQRRGTRGIRRDVVDAGFPNTFRLLCRNCNWIAFLERADEEEDVWVA